ncbi:hypothetical protein HRbin37_00445 [bacterium HR37]|nr:hypothetical protein HRbin37_00445 [bacterium HR37]
MDIVGKVVSLVLLTVFGAASVVVFLGDSDVFQSLINEYNSHTGYSGKKTLNTSSNYSREQILKDDYTTIQPQIKPHTPPYPQKQLWTNTYSRPKSSDATRRLAEKNTLNDLIESATYWYREYIQTLRSGEEEKAEMAYRRYTEYKEAIELKKSLEERKRQHN